MNIEKLFKIEKTHNFRIFNLFGIKFKISRKEYKNTKLINDFLYLKILESWRNNGASQELMCFLNFMETVNTFEDFNFILIHICCFLENNNINEAKRMLDKYMMLCGNTDCIAQFLPVSKLAVECGINDDLIRYSASLFDKFEQSHNSEKFINLVKNKSIAVVGNGPQEMGTNHGNEIDSHDIVIRFNKFKTSGYEKDYGCKTDIWVRNVESVNKNWGIPKDCMLTIYKNDYWHDIFPVKKYYQFFDINQDCDYIGIQQKNIVKKYFPNQSNATLGFTIATWLYDNIKTFDNIDFYGFSFLEDDYKGCLHYFDNQNNLQKSIEEHHHHKEESRILKELVQKNR